MTTADISTNTENKYALDNVFVAKEKREQILRALNSKKNIVLEGPTGTGKSFIADRIVKNRIGDAMDERCVRVCFHPNYNYENFIEGYWPSLKNGFEIKRGIFYDLCKKAEANPSQDYYLLIEEINRGNLFEIFGDVLPYIRPDQRGQSNKATLHYSNEPFSVPENLCIIGTMASNGIIQRLDFPFRKYFAVIQMPPAFDTEAFQKYQKQLNSKRFDALIETIEEINEEIRADSFLGEDYLIGHSYFCNLTTNNMSDYTLNDIVEYYIIPTLKEYWRDDPDLIRDWSDKLKKAIK